VSELDESRFDEAYPLAKTALPDLDIEHWRAFLKRVRSEQRGGCLVVENKRHVMLAFAAFRPCHDLQDGSCLEVDPLIVMDLVGAGTVAKVMETRLQEHARRQGCTILRLSLARHASAPGEDRALAAFLQCGLATDAWRLKKHLKDPALPA